MAARAATRESQAMRTRAALSFAGLALLCACGRIAPGTDDGLGAANPGNASEPPLADGGSSSSTPADRDLSLDLAAMDIAMDGDAIFVADLNERVHRVGRADGADVVIATSDASLRQIAIGGSSVYFVAGDDVAPGAPPAKSELVRVAKDGSSSETLRSSLTSPEEGIRAVATTGDAVFWIEERALWTMPLASSDVLKLADVPSAYGKIAAHDGYVYVTELDPTTHDFDVRRFDPKSPGASVFYPSANGSQSVAFLGADLFVVEGQRGTRYEAPKGAGDPWAPGDGAFAVTANASTLFVTALDIDQGNSPFRVDAAAGERVLVARGGELGPSVMCADDRAVAWTDNGTLHLTPLD